LVREVASTDRRAFGMGHATRKAGRRTWVRLQQAVAGALLTLAAAAVPIGAAVAAAQPAQSVFKYYDLHPCQLLTAHQVEAVFGVAVGPGFSVPSTSGGGTCKYSTGSRTIPSGPLRGELGSVDLGFGLGTAAAQKPFLFGGPFQNEPPVGHGAFCVTKMDAGALYANVGTYRFSRFSSAVYLSIGGDGLCTYSVQFAKDVFGRLS
jgi:hypothetical protein